MQDMDMMMWMLVAARAFTFGFVFFTVFFSLFFLFSVSWEKGAGYVLWWLCIFREEDSGISGAVICWWELCMNSVL
jgi:hypothetical protein